MHTDPDWRKLWTVLPFCKLCRTLHFDCLCSVFVWFILTCVLLLLCDIRLQFENYVDCWPWGVSCFWTRLNCAPVFSTFLLSIGKDRGIVLREQNYMRSRAVCSQRSKLRRNYWICAGWVCKRFSGQVRAEWLFYSKQTAPPSAGDPIRVDSQMPQVRVLVFDVRFFLTLYVYAWIHVGCGPDLMSHTCCTYSCTHMSVTHQTYKLWCDTAYEHTIVSFVFRVVASVVRLPDMRKMKSKL